MPREAGWWNNRARPVPLTGHAPSGDSAKTALLSRRSGPIAARYQLLHHVLRGQYRLSGFRARQWRFPIVERLCRAGQGTLLSEFRRDGSDGTPFCSVPLVVIDDFDLISTTIAPDEAQSVLIVDSQAMLSVAVSFESFKPIAGWYTQVIQSARRLENVKLQNDLFLDGHKRSRATTTLSDISTKTFVPERTDHGSLLSQTLISVDTSRRSLKSVSQVRQAHQVHKMRVIFDTYHVSAFPSRSPCMDCLP